MAVAARPRAPRVRDIISCGQLAHAWPYAHLRHTGFLVGLPRKALAPAARWVARFDVGSCVAVLERTCPDYRGLHVNLCDLLMPHERELARA